MASLASEFEFDGIEADAEDSLLELVCSGADGELLGAWQALAERGLRVLLALAFIAATAALWWPVDARAQKVAAPAVAQTASVSAGSARRIKEVAAVQGVRSNQLVGYGLVVGLDGTGDQTTQTPFTTQSLQAMLQQLGITVPAGTSMQLRNVAAVLVTAQLPAFATPGQNIDVNVSSVGNAKSLRGGTLIATPLKGADGQIYALAQGNLIVGGAGASAGGSKVQINHLSAGRVPEGATVERSVPTPLMDGETLQLGLNASDFATARAVADAINAAKGAGTASALDGRTIRVKAPRGDERVGFLADIENLPISLARPAARIVLNARTGSIVMNEAVTLAACAVAHGNLSVTITNTPVVSQPTPLSGGQTVSRDRTDISVVQHPGSLIQMGAGAKLTDVVKALSALGATPLDLLAILQAMKTSGALNAEIEVI
ncbi:MAG: flagellar basal body P-ring protein FlgI [Rubrivivax sp.]|nr:flagellar basal body P-ring protein FlgI [Rubrivivax sp.]